MNAILEIFFISQSEARTAKFNCTIRQCNQCATVFMKKLEVNCNKNSAVVSCHKDAADWIMLMEDYFEKDFSKFYNMKKNIYK